LPEGWVQNVRATREDLGLYLARLFLPVTEADGTRAVLCADLSAENRMWIRAYTGGLPLRAVSPQEISATLCQHFGPALLDEAVFGLARRTPELSAQTVVTRRQTVTLALLGLMLAGLLAWHTAAAGRAVVLVLSLAYIASGLFRTCLALLGSGAAPKIAPATAALPLYTILVPLYREVAVLPALVKAMRALDYPAEKLDIKLVLEADDRETIAAARQLCGTGAAAFDLVLVPPGGPRTKPKAINYALAFARGEYLVIYDAEDRPQPDQLRRAVATFRASPRTMACLQARLNFYNARHNWLTCGIMEQTPLAFG
jgi:hypothetical protein